MAITYRTIPTEVRRDPFFIKSWAHLEPVTVAFLKAVIHKSYLTWLDIQKVILENSKRAKMKNEYLILKGPVVIFAPQNPMFSKIFQFVVPTALLAIFYPLFLHLLSKPNEEVSWKKKVGIFLLALVPTLLLAFLTSNFSSKFLMKETLEAPGIKFFDSEGKSPEIFKYLQ